MNHKALSLSIFFTVFTLGIIAGVVRAMLSLQTREIQAIPTEAASAQIAQIQPTPFQPLPTPEPTPDWISPDAAAKIGLIAAGENEILASTPEMINFNGFTAYEVRMVDGSMLYINALDGSLLYNSITGSNKPVISQDQALLNAIEYIKYDQVVSIGLTFYNNQNVYLIRFWNGANVYENLAGEIVAVQYIQYASNNSSSSSSSTSNSGASSGSEREYEREDEDDD